MNEPRPRKTVSRVGPVTSGAKQELRSQRFRSFMAIWAKRHMPDRVKRFSVRA